MGALQQPQALQGEGEHRTDPRSRRRERRRPPGVRRCPRGTLCSPARLVASKLQRAGHRPVGNCKPLARVPPSRRLAPVCCPLLASITSSPSKAPPAGAAPARSAAAAERRRQTWGQQGGARGWGGQAGGRAGGAAGCLAGNIGKAGGRLRQPTATTARSAPQQCSVYSRPASPCQPPHLMRRLPFTPVLLLGMPATEEPRGAEWGKGSESRRGPWWAPQTRGPPPPAPNTDTHTHTHTHRAVPRSAP